MLRLQYIQTLRRGLGTFREMMIDRQCKDPMLSSDKDYNEWSDSIIKQTIEQKEPFFHRVMKHYKEKDSEAHVMVCVIRKAKLAQIRQEMKKVSSKFLIVLSLFPMSSNNEKFLSSKVHPTMRIQLFYCKNMQINITKNAFVPKHRLMSEDEKGVLFKKLKIDDSQIGEFPLLTRKDPIVLYYDFPAGGLIEIVRHEPYIGNTKYYRWIR